MHNKAFIYIWIFVIVFYVEGGKVLSTHHNNSLIELEVDKVEEIMDLTISNGLIPEVWKITARETKGVQITKENKERLLKNLLTKINNNYSLRWYVHKDNQNLTKLTGYNKEGNLCFKIITYGSGGLYRVDFIYETSEKYQSIKRVNDRKKEIKREINELFNGTTRIFACVTSHSNDKLLKVLEYNFNDILLDLNAEKVEQVEEESFASISAYTILWKSTVSSKSRKINVQLAARENVIGKQTTVTIGTPILIYEY